MNVDDTLKLISDWIREGIKENEMVKKIIDTKDIDFIKVL